MNAPRRFYGKYRGTVINNIDPIQMGRIQAMVPDVSTHSTQLGDACVRSPEADGDFVVPQIGAGVWMEFEQGDPTTRSGSAASGGSPRRSRRSPWPGAGNPTSCCRACCRTPS